MQGTVVNQEDSLEVTRTVPLKINCLDYTTSLTPFDKIVVISLEYSFVIILAVLKPSISRFHHDLTIT